MKQCLTRTFFFSPGTAHQNIVNAEWLETVDLHKNMGIEREEETWGCDGFISLKFQLMFLYVAFPLFRQSGQWHFRAETPALDNI